MTHAAFGLSVGPVWPSCLSWRTSWVVRSLPDGGGSCLWSYLSLKLMQICCCCCCCCWWWSMLKLCCLCWGVLGVVRVVQRSQSLVFHALPPTLKSFSFYSLEALSLTLWLYSVPTLMQWHYSVAGTDVLFLRVWRYSAVYGDLTLVICFSCADTAVFPYGCSVSDVLTLGM